MDLITFDKLLLNIVFCCMACDGNINSKEIGLQKVNKTLVDLEEKIKTASAAHNAFLQVLALPLI